MHNLIHDFPDLWCDLLPFQIRPDGKVAAGYIEPDAAQRNFILVGNHAADRLRITLMSIGAKHTALSTGRDARLDLLDRRFVMLTEDLGLGFHRSSSQ